MLDIKKIREDFPALNQSIYNKPLVYLDNAATSFKPQSVIDELIRHYQKDTSNIHRGIHYLSEQATKKYERSRKRTAQFIGAKENEIIFTGGTTESINLVAYSLGLTFSSKDKILLSTMEHHSNIIPWQLVAKHTKAKIEEIPVDEKGDIDISAYEKLLTKDVKIIGITHASNTLGTVNPIEQIIEKASKKNILTLVDAAQSIPHIKIDVKKLNCDFLAFSSHKLLGPTGLGVLYGKYHLLEKLSPFQGGGGMIDQVSLRQSTFIEPPHKFEAGTPPIAQAIAFEKSLDYLENLGMDKIMSYEEELLDYAMKKLKTISGINILGNPRKRIPVISFDVQGIHSQDMGSILNRQGIAVRTGHHCNRPLLEYFNLSSITRASFCLYNTKKEVDILTKGIQKAKDFF
ncbi:MAG: SufS family cysteine desulfurase [Halobacteriovoraceae bacterium]|nr:SufS family cysteine desulfurase [Halobacteriovoraceae bacterium]